QTIFGEWTRRTSGQRQMGVLVPGRGLDRCDDRLPSLGQTRCSGGPALSDKSLGRGGTIPRRGSSIPTSTPLIHPPLLSSKPAVFWKRTVLFDRPSILKTFGNRTT